ncbi:MFS transporter [Vannielia litorea]|uniref:Predicted arabinose efflux permease, MFS family n=1 Tax=Vannielia litorea TaxID=1217970 RepID=A0A1N6FHT2_9RHOB|nr:MFS transporter [Vannielia litorea]SIN94790.1 Predicted arabinose efflux permease, MFS family [Vannielia litorea]
MTSPDRTNWPLVVLLYALGLLAAGHFAKVALTLAALGVRYPEAGAMLPFAVSMTSAAGILFGATAGIVVARFGARRVLLVAVVTGVALGAAEALLPGFRLFLALRLAEGFAHLAIVVAAPTLMAASCTDAHRGAVMGLWGTFFGVGFAVMSLAEKLFGTGVYWVHAGLLAVVGAVLAPLLPRGVGRGAVVAEGWLARHVAIYTSARRFAPALMFFWHALMFMSLITFLPGFLGEWTAPLLPLVALLGTFWAGAATRRVSPERLALGAFAAGAVLMLAFWALPGARLAIAVPMLLAFGAVPGAAFAAAPLLNPDPADTARANGAIAQFGNIGTALSIPLFSLALGAGLGGMAALVVGLSLAGMMAVGLIFRRVAAS